MHGVFITVVSFWGETRAPRDLLPKSGTVHLLKLGQILQWHLSTAVSDMTLDPYLHETALQEQYLTLRVWSVNKIDE